MNKIAAPFKVHFDRVYGMLEALTENCPDDLWGKKVGGFLYWQQLYHVFALVDAFVEMPGKKPADLPYPAEVARLLRDEPQAPSKAEVLKVAKAMQALGDSFLESLTEEDMWKKHEGRSQRLGRDVNVHEALLLLVGHGYYHVGICDSALRDRGIKGMM